MDSQEIAEHLRKIASHLEKESVESDQHLEEAIAEFPWCKRPVVVIREDEDRLDKIDQKLDKLLDECSSASDAARELDTTLRLLVTDQNKKEGVRTLERWMNDAQNLTIADPYFFSFNNNSAYRTKDQYIEYLKESVPTHIDRLRVYHLPGPDGEIKSEFRNFARRNGVDFENYITTDIHDRVWIKNKDKAKVVGTSFGGLGNKASFILDLPKPDLENFKRELFKVRDSQR